MNTLRTKRIDILQGMQGTMKVGGCAECFTSCDLKILFDIWENWDGWDNFYRSLKCARWQER